MEQWDGRAVACYSLKLGTMLCRWFLSCHGVNVFEFVSGVVEVPLGYLQELTTELKRRPREVATRAPRRTEAMSSMQYGTYEQTARQSLSGSGV